VPITLPASASITGKAYFALFNQKALSAVTLFAHPNNTVPIIVMMTVPRIHFFLPNLFPPKKQNTDTSKTICVP